MPYYRRSFGGELLPPAIKGLLIANVAVYIFEYFFGFYRIGEASLGGLIFRYFALFPTSSDYFYVWQVFTYQYLHGGFYHIFFNMLMLWMFGAELDRLWGPRRFFVFYTLGGIGAGLTQLFLSPFFGGAAPTVGASGSIYAVMLAYAITFPNRMLLIFPLFIPVKAKYLMIILVAMDFILGITTTSDVAHLAHVGGALAGWLLIKYGDRFGIFDFFEKIFPKGSRGGSSAYWEKGPFESDFDGRKRSPFSFNFGGKKEPEMKVYSPKKAANSFEFEGEVIAQEQIDEILDKISERGYQSLTDREKAILLELSKKL